MKRGKECFHLVLDKVTEEHAVRVLRKYLDPSEVCRKLQRRGVTGWKSEEEMYRKFYNLHLKFPTRPELAEGIPQTEDGRAKEPLFEIMWCTDNHVWLCMRYDFRGFPKGHVIRIGQKLFDMVGVEFTDLFLMGITNRSPNLFVERWDYAMFLHYVTCTEGVVLPNTRDIRWKLFGWKQRQDTFYDQSFLGFRRRYFKLNRKLFHSLLPFDVTLQELHRGREEMDLLSRYMEQEREGRASEILIQAAYTVVTDDDTNVLLHNMLSMFFLGEDSPEYRKSLEELYDFIGYGQHLTREADGSWRKAPGSTKLDGTVMRFGSGSGVCIVDQNGNETPLSDWTGDSTVPWFHEEDYERQEQLQGKLEA